MAEKIKMTTPIVEMDGDEMTRILWKMIKDELILPFVDLKTEYYDLGLVKRDETRDQITVEAAEKTKELGVAVKCATITPNLKRMDEYKLHEMWKSPNGTIRSILDGTVFRAPITIPSIKPVVKNWEKPITIARHAYGDVYKSVEIRADEPGVAKMVFEGESGKKEEVVIHEFKGPSVLVSPEKNATLLLTTGLRLFDFIVPQGKVSCFYSAAGASSTVVSGMVASSSSTATSATAGASSLGAFSETTSKGISTATSLWSCTVAM